MDANRLYSAVSGYARNLARGPKWSLAIVVIAGLAATVLPGQLWAAAPRVRVRLRPHPRAVRHLPPHAYRRLPPRVVRPVVIPRHVPRLVIPPRPPVAVHYGPRAIPQVLPPTLVIAAKQIAVLPAPEFASAQAYRVVQVDDRYLVTLSINGVKTPVRLVGVDPPLVAAAEGLPKPPLAALHFLQNLLAGELVYLDRDPNLAPKDAEGNLVAYLYRVRDKKMINLELVRKGYALVAEGYDFGLHKQFLAAQQKARAERLGIWALLAGTEL